jgi:transposase InsO family protein
LHSDIEDTGIKEKANLVLEWERRWQEAQGGAVDMAELCRKYRVSRPPGLESQTIPPEIEDWIVQAQGDAEARAALLDADTRYLLRAEPMLDPTGDVEKVLDSAFQEFGLPKAMRSDNGPPFASTAAGRLSRLSVWWLKPGIQLERIEPGKPQQNGRLERCHLTIEEAVTPRPGNWWNSAATSTSGGATTTKSGRFRLPRARPATSIDRAASGGDLFCKECLWLLSWGPRTSRRFALPDGLPCFPPSAFGACLRPGPSAACSGSWFPAAARLTARAPASFWLIGVTKA